MADLLPKLVVFSFALPERHTHLSKDDMLSACGKHVLWQGDASHTYAPKALMEDTQSSVSSRQSPIHPSKSPSVFEPWADSFARVWLQGSKLFTIAVSEHCVFRNNIDLSLSVA